MVRAKIQATQIINRLMQCVLGKVRLSGEQVSAARILLAKSLPDLQHTEITGPYGGPVQGFLAHADVSDADAMKAYLKLTGAG
jgi:hypothetical protein